MPRGEIPSRQPEQEPQQHWMLLIGVEKESKQRSSKNEFLHPSSPAYLHLKQELNGKAQKSGFTVDSIITPDGMNAKLRSLIEFYGDERYGDSDLENPNKKRYEKLLEKADANNHELYMVGATSKNINVDPYNENQLQELERKSHIYELEADVEYNIF